jgi:hypothetical protein
MRKVVHYTFLGFGISARCTSAAEAGGFIDFTAGLKTCSTRRRIQQSLKRITQFYINDSQDLLPRNAGLCPILELRWSGILTMLKGEKEQA